MKLSTKSTYGLRAMVDIALNFKKDATSIADISARESISQDYLEQLLNRLRREGLVRSLRGPKGGYILSRAPAKITVGDIVKSLEGAMTLAHCASARAGMRNHCKKDNSCVSQIVWARLEDSITDCLDSITLKDLCAEDGRPSRRSLT